MIQDSDPFQDDPYAADFVHGPSEPFRVIRSDRKPDPDHPHVSCLVADRNLLQDGMLSTSQVMTALYLAVQYYDETPGGHGVIPVSA